MMLKRGITIMEVLIVISILALLFAFLIPALNPLKASSQFHQKIALFKETLTNQRMKAQGGFTHNATNQERQALGLHLSTEEQHNLGGAYEIAYTITPSGTPDLPSKKLSPYNILSEDILFSEKNTTTSPLAKITELKAIINGQPTTYTSLDIIYLPNSNEYLIVSPSNTLLSSNRIYTKICSIQHASRCESFEISPSTGSIITQSS